MLFQEKNNWSSLYHPQRNLGKPGSFRRVQAVYVKSGKIWRDGKGGKRVFDRKALFRDVKTIDGRYGTDHLWVDWKSEFEVLKPGDKVEFGGIVQTYFCKGDNGTVYRSNTQLGQIQEIKIL